MKRADRRLDMEQSLAIILNGDMPSQRELQKERAYLKRGLSNIVKYDFATSNNDSMINGRLPGRIVQGFMSLYEKWRKDITIARLLLTSLRNVLTSFSGGQLVAEELCKCASGSKFTALLDSLFNGNTDNTLALSTCEIMMALLQHQNAASDLGEAFRSKARRYLLDILAHNKNDAQFAIMCLSLIILVLRGSSINEQQKFAVKASVDLLVEICNCHWEKGIILGFMSCLL